jgi:hypothetical protein
MAYSKNQTVVNSVSIGFPGAIKIQGYLLSSNWGGLLSTVGIAFDTSLGTLAGRYSTGSASFNFSQSGIYRVRASADNHGEPQTTFNIVGATTWRSSITSTRSGSGSNVSESKRCAGFLSNNGKVTYFKIPSAGNYTFNIGIKNTDAGTELNPITAFVDNPMGMAFVIEYMEGLPAPPAPPTPPGTPPPPPDPPAPPIGTGPVPGGCPPGPWEPSVPTCASPPSTQSQSGGLQITTDGEDKVTLNLANYAGKLVTLKVTNFLGTAAWVNNFGFNIPEASDIIAQPGGALGGSIYNRAAFSGQMGGTKTYYICNLDGGNYDFDFIHSSVPGEQPKRDLFEEVCITHEDGSQSCSCAKVGVEYYEPWPKCGPELAIKKNGGSQVSWCYEDGGGSPYCDQEVTVEVISTRDVLPSGSSADICLDGGLQTYVWAEDVGNASADGKCFSEYKNHSEPERFRDPTNRASISIPEMLCFKDFIGYSGAKTPGELGI